MQTRKSHRFPNLLTSNPLPWQAHGTALLTTYQVPSVYDRPFRCLTTMHSLDLATLTLPELLQRYRAKTAHLLGFDEYLRLIHAFHSVGIDGCSLSFIEIEVFLDKGFTAGGRPLSDHLMVLDQVQAFNQTLAMACRREPLNRAALQHLAASAMQRTGETIRTLTTSMDTSQGDWRTVEIIPAHPTAIDARKLPAALDVLLKEINSGLERVKTIRQVYDLSFRAHYQLLLLQPFGAGNGRVARLVMNYMQHYHALPLSLVQMADRQAYFASVAQSRRQQTDQPLSVFLHTQLTHFLRGEINRFTAV